MVTVSSLIGKIRPRSDGLDEAGLLSVNYAGFAPILVEGLKELKSGQELAMKGLEDLKGKQKLETGRLAELEETQRLEIAWLKERAIQQDRQLENAQKEWAARDLEQSLRMTRAQKRIDGLEKLAMQQASQIGQSHDRLLQLEDTIQLLSSRSLRAQRR